MNIADIMLLYFITCGAPDASRSPVPAYPATALSHSLSLPLPLLFLSFSSASSFLSLVAHPLVAFCISSFMRPGFGFRPRHSGISPYARILVIQPTLETRCNQRITTGTEAPKSASVQRDHPGHALPTADAIVAHVDEPNRFASCLAPS